MLVEVKFSIFATQEFLFLGMIDNICDSFVSVLSIVNFKALSGTHRGLQTNLLSPINFYSVTFYYLNHNNSEKCIQFAVMITFYSLPTIYIIYFKCTQHAHYSSKFPKFPKHA